MKDGVAARHGWQGVLGHGLSDDSISRSPDVWLYRINLLLFAVNSPPMYTPQRSKRNMAFVWWLLKLYTKYITSEGFPFLSKATLFALLVGSVFVE